MTLFRRTLMLITLMFWQGGFMFYGGLVVPVGSQVLGSHKAMSRITQPVTDYLNMAGIVALGCWAWDLGSRPARRRWLTTGLWLLLAVSLLAQFALHRELDAMMTHLGTVTDAAALAAQQAHFRIMHQVYLIVSTAQWALALALLAFTVGKWRDEDRGLVV